MPETTPLVSHIRDAFLKQAQYCEHLGSPFMVRLCRLFADNLEDDNAVSTRLLNSPYSGFLWNEAVPLRIAGALHALVLNGECAALATVYPPNHDSTDDDSLWQAICHAMEVHSDTILPCLDIAPQTNEVRRCSALLPGFLSIAKETALPFVLSEPGASAGITLCWDSFSYNLNGQTWGNTGSNIHLTPGWSGNPPPPAVAIDIRERAACDLYPVDYRNPEKRLRLLSYIWADQAERFALTENALAVLEARNYPVEQADISDWLPQRLNRDTAGAVHVIYHTIVWGYQTPEAREANARKIAAAGASATVDSPLAWLRLEPDGEDPGAAILLNLWPGGETRCLGRADYHGRWVDWQA